MDRPKLFLIDGSSYLFRAFYAIGHLSNSKGLPTNAAFGFTQMLLKVLKDHRPDAPDSLYQKDHRGVSNRPDGDGRIRGG